VPALISHKGRRPPAGRTLPFRAGRSMRRRSVTRAVRRGKRKPRSRSGAIRQLVLGEGYVRKCRPVSQRSPRRTVSVAATRNGASGPPTDARPLSGPVRVARSARVLRPGPPPIPERDPGPYVAPSPGFYPPPLVRPQLTRLRPRHKHDKRRVETQSMKSRPPPSAASIIPAIKKEPSPSIKSGPSPSTASSTAPSLAALATQAPAIRPVRPSSPSAAAPGSI
jgi:hypothetical protein